MFIPPVVAEFGISHEAANLGIAALSVVMTLSGLVVGPILDRRSIRAVMVVGALLMAGGFALMSQARAPWQLVVLFGVAVALGVTMFGPLPAMTVVAKWFEQRRGRALGIVSMGPVVGILTFTLAAGAVIERIGWRVTLLGYAAVTGLMIPILWLAIRNRPQDIGQLPDGAPPVVGGGGSHADLGAQWTTFELLRTRAFWALALALGIVFGILQGWLPNLIPFALHLGLSVPQASLVAALAAGLGIPGTLLFGAMADRVNNRALLWTAMGFQILSLALLHTQPGFGALIAIIAVMGLTGGGLQPVYASLVGRIFGPASFGRVIGLAGVVMLPFAAAAPPLIGRLRDATGNYARAQEVLIVALAVSALILGALRVEPLAPPSSLKDAA